MIEIELSKIMPYVFQIWLCLMMYCWSVLFTMAFIRLDQIKKSIYIWGVVWTLVYIGGFFVKLV